MATFSFEATITVNGTKTKEEAISAIQVMLKDYGDMNAFGPDISMTINTKASIVPEDPSPNK